MSNISLNLSGKLEQGIIEIFHDISEITDRLGISYIIVGATARDLVLYHGYGSELKSATYDIDFGIEVKNWEEYQKLKDELLKHNFTLSRIEHRLFTPNNIPIDIVPFGALSDHVNKIFWPPKGDIEMNVMGFQEAHKHSINVILKDSPKVEIKVATPQGLVLLKLIAWSDRKNEGKKDARDFSYLLETYQNVSGIMDRIYEIDGLMEQYDWEISLASAHLLGNDTALIAERDTCEKINEIIENSLHKTDSSTLIDDMCEQINEEYKQKREMVKAFSNGLNNKYI